MKLTLVAFILVGSLHIIFAHSNPKKFQDVNVDIVLGNDRVLTNYIMCLLDQKPCSREGLELKKLLPDAIRGDCNKCSTAQRRSSKKVLNFLRTRRPQDWKALTEKYDPQGVFKQRLDLGLI